EMALLSADRERAGLCLGAVDPDLGGVAAGRPRVGVLEGEVGGFGAGGGDRLGLLAGLLAVLVLQADRDLGVAGSAVGRDRDHDRVTGAEAAGRVGDRQVGAGGG